MTPADDAMLSGWAERLDAALRTRVPIAQAADHERLSLEAAYAVQRRLFTRRLERGERSVGFKLGMTQAAVRQRLGIAEPLLGRLTDMMQHDAREPLALARYLKPRLEAEVAFVLGRPLAGEVDLATALAAVDGVMPALEIIDTRYRDFRLSIPDLVADNTSAAGFVLGRPVPLPDRLDAAILRLTVDGQLRQQAPASAIMGHPGHSIRAAARIAAAAGESLPAGSIILAGCAAEPLTVAPGERLVLDIEGLGALALTIGPN